MSTIETEIKTKKTLIAFIREQITDAPTFKAKEESEAALREAEFDLGVLQREAEAQAKLATERARQDAIEKFAADKAAYEAAFYSIADLDETMIKSLDSFDVALSELFNLTMNLNAQAEHLTNEAARLKLEAPAAPKYPRGNGLIGRFLEKWLVANGCRSYTSRLIAVNFSPILKGVWVDTGY